MTDEQRALYETYGQHIEHFFVYVGKRMGCDITVTADGNGLWKFYLNGVEKGLIVMWSTQNGALVHCTMWVGKVKIGKNNFSRGEKGVYKDEGFFVSMSRVAGCICGEEALAQFRGTK